MNYIHQLQTDIETLHADAATRADRIREFRAHLLSAKFHPIQQDGSRGDWISTGDVMNWLLYIEDTNRLNP
jgi:hypothetical protein